MGADREYGREELGRTVRLGEVLLRSDTGGIVVWGGDLGIDGVNGAEDRGS